MKHQVMKFSLAFVVAFTGALTSCSDGDNEKFNDEGSSIEMGNHRVFILNEGTSGMNNASITYYNPANSEIVDNLFYVQNHYWLGDNGNGLIEYRDNMYVALFGSNYIARLNSAGIELTRTEFASDPDLQGGVRSIDAEDGYIYASFYGGVIAKIDCKSLEVVSKTFTSGKNLEDLVVENGKVYVANSYEILPDPTTGYNIYNYLQEIIVVDCRTMQQITSITVAPNPNRLLATDDRVFVISNDYSQESYVLQMIEPDKNNQVTVLGWATDMTAGDVMLYLVDSRTDYTTIPFTTTNSFYTYDIKRGSMNNKSFMVNAPDELASSSVYSMAVDDANGDIYVNTTFYTYSNGDCYRFDRTGRFVEKFDCGGQNPRAMVFLNR